MEGFVPYREETRFSNYTQVIMPQMWSQTDIFTWKYLNITYIGTVWPASQAPMTGIKVFGGFFYNLKQFDMGFNLNDWIANIL